MSDNTIKRYAVEDCPQTYCCAPASICEDSDGDWVLYSDHLAALSRAREDARREALEEAAKHFLSRMHDEYLGPYEASEIVRALIPNTPQGETKEQP